MSPSLSARKKAASVRLGMPTMSSRATLAELGGLAGCDKAVSAFPETGSGGTAEQGRQPTMTMFLGATGLMMTRCLLPTRGRTG
jgi:hypothetical protein